MSALNWGSDAKQLSNIEPATLNGAAGNSQNGKLLLKRLKLIETATFSAVWPNGRFYVPLEDPGMAVFRL